MPLSQSLQIQIKALPRNLVHDERFEYTQGECLFECVLFVLGSGSFLVGGPRSSLTKRSGVLEAAGKALRPFLYLAFSFFIQFWKKFGLA